MAIIIIMTKTVKIQMVTLLACYFFCSHICKLYLYWQDEQSINHVMFIVSCVCLCVCVCVYVRARACVRVCFHAQMCLLVHVLTQFSFVVDGWTGICSSFCILSLVKIHYQLHKSLTQTEVCLKKKPTLCYHYWYDKVHCQAFPSKGNRRVSHAR